MIAALLLAVPSAFAEPTVTEATSQLFVGLPLTQLAEVGLELPTVPEVPPPNLRYPLPGGGFVVLVIAPTIAEADAAFDGMARTLATRWAPAAGPLPGARTLGDGQGALLFRERNAVVFVRDLGGSASRVGTRIVGGLVTDAAACAGDGVVAHGRATDACGRPR